jgi:hypothetical protein
MKLLIKKKNPYATIWNKAITCAQFNYQYKQGIWWCVYSINTCSLRYYQFLLVLSILSAHFLKKKTYTLDIFPYTSYPRLQEEDRETKNITTTKNSWEWDKSLTASRGLLMKLAQDRQEWRKLAAALHWLIIYGFTSRSRIFHLYGDVAIAPEGLQNLGLCSVLKAIEQGGIFIVPHLLWHGTLVFPVSSERPIHPVSS